MRVQEDLTFGKGSQYPWEVIFDGKKRVLTQTVPAKTNPDGTVTPAVPGDFDVSLESMRNTACSAARERGMKLVTTFLNDHEIGLQATALPPAEAEAVKAKLKSQRDKAAAQAKAKAEKEKAEKAKAAKANGPVKK